ncbi:unnamed protein product [Caenorhabditis bovis]|uniref:Uncharacterized protein n=1 Tax=Caenorhabditis bovis TaxID=2654633 RepID=A0A8S1F453_9PELO|nr:unnamed protein product [Caenorhabditis bovis]
MADTNSIFDVRSASDLDKFENDACLARQLMDDGLLASSQMCDKCGRTMMLRNRVNTLEWRCRETKNRDCSTRSVRIRSWFENSKISLKTMMKLIVLYLNGETTKSMEQATGVSRRTVIHIRAHIKELCERILKRNDDNFPIEIVDVRLNLGKIFKNLTNFPTSPSRRVILRNGLNLYKNPEIDQNCLETMRSKLRQFFDGPNSIDDEQLDAIIEEMASHEFRNAIFREIGECLRMR